HPRPPPARALPARAPPARRASSRCESPAPSRASSTIDRASTPQMISETTSLPEGPPPDAVLRRPGPAAAPVEEPGHEGTEREPTDVCPVRHPAAPLRPELAHAAEQLEHEPDGQHDAGGDLDDRDEEEDYQRQEPGAREQHDVRAEDPPDRAGRAQARDRRVRGERELQPRGRQPTQHVEE